jgi:hypothetical protein
MTGPRDEALGATAGAREDTEKQDRAKATLPSTLHRTFDQLVDDYAVSVKIHVGEVVVEYDVLADLVRAGWRRVT